MTDGDPRNDFVVTYSLRVTAQIPTSGVFVGVSGGVLERFVTQPDESGVQLQDSSVETGVRHGLDSWMRGWSVLHRLKVDLPSSRFSLNQVASCAGSLNSRSV